MELREATVVLHVDVLPLTVAGGSAPSQGEQTTTQTNCSNNTFNIDKVDGIDNVIMPDVLEGLRPCFLAKRCPTVRTT